MKASTKALFMLTAASGTFFRTTFTLQFAGAQVSTNSSSFPSASPSPSPLIPSAPPSAAPTNQSSLLAPSSAPDVPPSDSPTSSLSPAPTTASPSSIPTDSSSYSPPSPQATTASPSPTPTQSSPSSSPTSSGASSPLSSPAPTSPFHSSTVSSSPPTSNGTPNDTSESALLSCTDEVYACIADDVCRECEVWWGVEPESQLACEERYPVLQGSSATLCEEVMATYCCYFEDQGASECLSNNATLEYMECIMESNDCSLSDLPCDAQSVAVVAATSGAASRAPSSSTTAVRRGAFGILVVAAFATLT